MAKVHPKNSQLQCITTANASTMQYLGRDKNRASQGSMPVFHNLEAALV